MYRRLKTFQTRTYFQPGILDSALEIHPYKPGGNHINYAEMLLGDFCYDFLGINDGEALF